jgi:AcrR family transcriptional regulator
MDLKSFEKQVAVSTEDICREIFRNRSGSIKIKKEPVAVKNLVKIFRATLKLANRKGFHAMSLRDLCAESGMSMGGLYAYFKNKEELLTLIQEQGRAIVARVMGDQLAGIDDAARALDRGHPQSPLPVRSAAALVFFLLHGNPFFHAEEGKRAIAGELQTEGIFSDILEKGIAERGFYHRRPAAGRLPPSRPCCRTGT